MIYCVFGNPATLRHLPSVLDGVYDLSVAFAMRHRCDSRILGRAVVCLAFVGNRIRIGGPAGRD